MQQPSSSEWLSLQGWLATCCVAEDDLELVSLDMLPHYWDYRTEPQQADGVFFFLPSWAI